MGQDLFAFTQGLLLTGALATAGTKRLRYALSHTAGRLTYSARTTTLRLRREWPWARVLAEAFNTLQSLPLTT